MASTGNPSDPLAGAGKIQSPGTTQTPRTTETPSRAEAAQGAGEHLTDRARKKAGEVMEQAGETAHDMRERARSAVDQQKDAAAGRIEGVAQALRSASDDLEHRGQPMVAEYSRQVAEGLESMANWVSRRNIDDMVGGIEDFARQRPIAFMGGAMVAGFALARFMKSSSARRSRPGGSDYGREYRGTSGSYGQGSYRPGMPRRSEYGGANTGTSGSYGQERPERREHGGAATGTSGSTPPGSGGTTPAGSSSRPTEGGI
jgi:hypothetical protein